MPCRHSQCCCFCLPWKGEIQPPSGQYFWDALRWQDEDQAPEFTGWPVGKSKGGQTCTHTHTLLGQVAWLGRVEEGAWVCRVHSIPAAPACPAICFPAQPLSLPLRSSYLWGEYESPGRRKPFGDTRLRSNFASESKLVFGVNPSVDWPGWKPLEVRGPLRLLFTHKLPGPRRQSEWWGRAAGKKGEFFFFLIKWPSL